MNPEWELVNPKTIFIERSTRSRPDDVHLTPSQLYGVLPQAEYIEKNGTGVVLNLVGSDNMKHVEADDFIIHLRSFQGGIEHSPFKGKVSNAYCVLQPSVNIEPRFYRWVLKSGGYIQELNSTTNQLRDGQSIKFEHFASIGLPLPAFSEQTRMADFLDSQIALIDQLIANKKSQISLIWENVSSKMSDKFLNGDQKNIRLKRLISDEKLGIWGEEPGVNPVDVSVARVADFNRNIFKLNDVETKRSIEFNQFKNRKIEIGDILLERSGGGDKSPVGCAVYVNKDIPNLVCSNFVSRVRAALDVDSPYLSLLFATLYLNGMQRPHSSQTTGIQNLDTESYFQTEVPLRKLSEQVELARFGRELLDSTAEIVECLDKSILALQNFKSSLITSVVTGTYDFTSRRVVA